MEMCLDATTEGCDRKEREAARREEDLTAALRAGDVRITKEQEVTEKVARDAATSASSSNPQPPDPVNSTPTGTTPAVEEAMNQGDESMQAEHRVNSGSFAIYIIPMDVRHRDEYVPSP